MRIEPHHVGICVSDLEASLRFWRDGLGFEATSTPTVGSEWSDALEIGGEIEFSATFLRKDGFEFELLYYNFPEPTGAPSATRLQLGFTHFAATVDDLDPVIDHLVAHGGTVVEGTRTRIGEGAWATELVFIADPNGVRVELMKFG
jgi:lactoylglutathione lyase